MTQTAPEATKPNETAPIPAKTHTKAKLSVKAVTELVEKLRRSGVRTFRLDAWGLELSFDRDRTAGQPVTEEWRA